MARRRLYPMPVEALFDHPAYKALPAAGAGLVNRLLEHFWLTDCRPLPNDEGQLFAIARAHRPTWQHYKTEIMKIFHDVAPEMQQYHAEREARRTQLRIAARNGAAVVKASHALAAAQKETVLPSVPSYASGHLPVKASLTGAPAPATTDRPLLTG